MWLREIIGYVLTELESGSLSETRELLVAQLQSGIVSHLFYWSRYRLTLKTADFMDDLSIVAPQDLMAGGAGGQQPQQPMMAPDFPGGGVDQEQNNLQNQMAEEQLNQMIN